MCGTGVRVKPKLEHSVSVAHVGAPGQKVEIRVDGNRVRVILREDEAEIGCTVVSREAVEILFDLFQKHFSRTTPNEIIVQ